MMLVNSTNDWHHAKKGQNCLKYSELLN